MKDSLKKVLSTVFVVLVILMGMVILDSSVDLSSDYAEEQAKNRYDFLMSVGHKDWSDETKELMAQRLEHIQTGQNSLLWTGIGYHGYLRAARGQEDFDIDAWLAAQERNTGSCPDCSWFSTVIYEPSTGTPETELCPHCGKALWDLSGN